MKILFFIGLTIIPIINIGCNDLYRSHNTYQCNHVEKYYIKKHLPEILSYQYNKQRNAELLRLGME